MNRLLILFILILTHHSAISQPISTNKYVLSGTVVNGATNEALMGANIISNKNIGATTNELGEFTISVSQNDTLKISYIGFKTFYYDTPIEDTRMYLIKFKLYNDSINLDEVVIYPWPIFNEFKEAFLILNKEDKKNTYGRCKNVSRQN